MFAPLLGAHIPIKGGLGQAVRTGHALGCRAIQVFTSSPRQWYSAPLSEGQIQDFERARQETGLTSVVSHDSYLINLAAPTPEIAEKSFASLKGEIERCGAYGIEYVVSHIASYKGQDQGETLVRTAEAILRLLDETDFTRKEREGNSALSANSAGDAPENPRRDAEGAEGSLGDAGARYIPGSTSVSGTPHPRPLPPGRGEGSPEAPPPYEGEGVGGGGCCVTLLMETTAGQGSDMNSRFEELAMLLDLTKAPARLGVCLDTCHIFAAGYPIHTDEGYEQTFKDFDRLIGLDRLKVIHCNDSVKGFGSRIDRHADIGEGQIGPLAFQKLVNDPRFANTPILLETEVEKHGMNLSRLKSYLISADRI